MVSPVSPAKRVNRRATLRDLVLLVSPDRRVKLDSLVSLDKTAFLERLDFLDLLVCLACPAKREKLVWMVFLERLERMACPACLA